MIGNPFTDVPELSSQAVVVTDGDAEAAEREAIRLAEAFWPDRGADAGRPDPGRGGGRRGDGDRRPGDLHRCRRRDELGRDRRLERDPARAPRRRLRGHGARCRSSTRRRSRPRSRPASAPRSRCRSAAPATRGSPRSSSRSPSTCCRVGTRCTRRWAPRTRRATWRCSCTGDITIVAITKPANFFDRSVFYAAGREPKRYDLIVVKSPHCEPHMYVEWAERNFNVDAPGSTSANLPTLGPHDLRAADVPDGARRGLHRRSGDLRPPVGAAAGAGRGMDGCMRGARRSSSSSLSSSPPLLRRPPTGAWPTGRSRS